MLICDLIDAIKPGSIKYNLLKTSGTPEVFIQVFLRIEILLFNQF